MSCQKVWCSFKMYTIFCFEYFMNLYNKYMFHMILCIIFQIYCTIHWLHVIKNVFKAIELKLIIHDITLEL